MFCSQLFYAPKKAETICFVTFLSGDNKKKKKKKIYNFIKRKKKKTKKKKQPLDSFKMSKKKALYFTCLLFYAFFVCKKLFIKK